MNDICKPAAFKVAESGEIGLQRSLSVPARSRCKNGEGLTFVPNANVTSACVEGAPDNPDGLSFRKNFGSRSYRRFRLSRKADIRVSKFEADGIDIPNEMMRTMRNVEECSLHDAVVTDSLPDERLNHKISKEDAMKQHEKTKQKTQGNINRLVKLLHGGARRITSKPGKQNFSSCYIIKTVEIVRKRDEKLGLFINKRKLSSEADQDLLYSGEKSECSNTRHGVFISRLSPNCFAAKEGLVQPGDEILAVNTVQVSSMHIQVIATMMCMLKRIILTVRRLRDSSSMSTALQPSSSNCHDHTLVIPRRMTKRTNPSLRGPLPESIVSEEVKFATTLHKTVNSASQNDSSKKSVYDNDFQLPPPRSTPAAQGSLIQSKFDESFKILLDAIAGCDRSKGMPPLVDVAGSSTEYPATQKPGSTTEPLEAPSLLSEILSTVESKQEWKPYWMMAGKRGAKRSEEIAQNCSPVEEEWGSFNRMPEESEYDEVASSDFEHATDASSSQEVNLDEYNDTLQFTNSPNLDNRRCSQDSSVSSCLSSVSGSSQSAEHALTTGRIYHRTTKSDDVLSGGSGGRLPDCEHLSRQQIKTFDDEKSKFCFDIPKFPTGTPISPPDVALQQHSSSITVDKKREWLHSGQVISSELKKRLDGNSGDKLLFKTQNIDHRQLFLHKKLHRSISNDSEPPTPLLARSASNESLVISSKPADCSMKRKASLRSPIEKSAKTLLSVSSPIDPTTKSFFSGDKSSTKDLSGKPQDSPFGLQGETSLIKDSVPKQIGANKNFEKVPSPSRHRKKNWSTKFAKKFRIMGSSENAGNEYSCWAAEDIGSELSPSKQAIDSAVLNLYHLDISMAQQRRLSRQLILDNRGREIHQRALSLLQFQKYKPLPLVDSPVDGCLVLTIYGARELKKALCEASCIAEVDEESKKRIGTTMQTCRGSTTWNQCFEMVVSQARELRLTVHTWDTKGGKHKPSAQASINLPSLVQGAKSRFRYSNRLAVAMEPRGTLYIRVALEEKPSSSASVLFGADLQSVVEREGGGHLVPRVVRSCIEEVEKRGTHVVGIYRLCGSAIVKKDLRRKLQEADGEVDLSSANYPDVNVITGILKDFLRELPQPLFPPELLEAVTQAMAQNPGPSPAPVVKEPFAPDPSFAPHAATPEPDNEQKLRTRALLRHIEKLPASQAEQATLYALMNHLKKISLHAHSNKMICQNLAVCFGPVLLGPAGGLDVDAAISFKRHIQVLNYMISNWPARPVRFHAAGRPAGDPHRVSLTRRLSRVYVIDGEDDPRASLASILESGTVFSDPDLDLRDQAASGV